MKKFVSVSSILCEYLNHRFWNRLLHFWIYLPSKIISLWNFFGLSLATIFASKNFGLGLCNQKRLLHQVTYIQLIFYQSFNYETIQPYKMKCMACFWAFWMLKQRKAVFTETTFMLVDIYLLILLTHFDTFFQSNK